MLKTKKLASALGAASLLLLQFILVAGCGESDAAHAPEMPNMDKFAFVAGVIRDKCMVCHSRSYDLPFYASIPGIRGIIEKDFTDGLRAMDLNEEFGAKTSDRPVSEVTLAKMEWVTFNETMPPAKFAAVHWNSRISRDQRASILSWIESARLKHYVSPNVAETRRNEPVQPLPDALETDPAKVALGKKLYNSVHLSADDSISCASCHDLAKGGADARQFSEGIYKQRGVANSPTVFNSAFNIRQFWDGRAADLREQAAGPPFNPLEMGSANWEQIIAKLCRDKDLLREFLVVYPYSWLGDSGGWNGKNITDAIAEYEKTLITPNSRFDKWLKGDDAALSREESEGYQRFKAYRCASCHVGKTLGGQSFEYMDLKKDYFADRGGRYDSDKGLAAFSKRKDDTRKFKVPNLRNVELTAPYLHDGTVNSLDGAVKVMGVYLVGLEVPQQDVDGIVLFLRTLTGEFEGRPLEGQRVAN
jgi:cytochrome c peroxidase